MTGKPLQICLGVIFSVGLAAAVRAQETPLIEERLLGPDPNNAVIEGRVTLPSGRSADINIKVTLSNSQSELTTFFTNKHGEFRFLNMSAGIYYVRVAGSAEDYEPVTQMVRLSRSQTVNLIMTLRKKAKASSPTSGERLISASEFNQQVPAAARKEYDGAVQLVGKGELEKAIERFQRALVIYPDYLMAHNDLGAQYLKLKRLDEAAEHFHIALARNPKYFHPRLNLGLVLIERKNYADAIAQLRQAIAIDDTRPAAHLWFGFALLQTGELPEAERELTKALITGGADFASAHYHLAQLYLKRGDSGEAARALRAYLEEARKGEHVEDARLLLKQLEAGNRPPPRL